MTTCDLLSLDRLSARQVVDLAERAVVLSRLWDSGAVPQTLSGYRVGLIVDDDGWRNTTALDLGVGAMGGLCVQVPVSLSGKEAIADVARYADNWFDLLAVRTPSLEALEALADAARIPVINLRTRTNHPFEVLGDLSFVWKVRGTIDGLTVAAVAPADNILHSWAEAASVLPLTLVQVFRAEDFVDAARYPAETIIRTEDMAAIEDADVIVTDCWPQGGDESALGRYRVTAERLDGTKPECLFLPCPPVTRGQEVSADAMDHPRCRVYEAKAFLLHAQNAFLEGACSAR